jgi:hypothetical protein
MGGMSRGDINGSHGHARREYASARQFGKLCIVLGIACGVSWAQALRWDLEPVV